MEQTYDSDPQSDIRSFSDLNAKPRCSKKRKVIFIILGALLCLGIIFFSLPSILGLFVSDISPINDSDLQLKKIEVAPEDNAFYDVLNMDEIFVYDAYNRELIHSYLEGENWDDESVEQILSNNEKALEFFTKASDKPNFQDPNFDSPEKISYYTVISGVRSISKVADLSSLKAIYFSRHNNYSAAADEAFKSLRIAQIIEDSQASLIHYCLASYLKDVGSATLRRLLSSADLSSEDLIKYTQALEDFKENKRWINTALKIEYRNVVGAIDLVWGGDMEYLEYLDEGSKPFAGQFNNNFYFQPNKIKQLFANYTRSAIDNVKKPCGLAEEPERKFFYAGDVLPSKFKLMFTENLIGKLLHDIVAVSFSGLYKKGCQSDLAISVTKIFFAMKAYKIENGDYPDKLVELVPKYISTIPEDPFSGGEIKYLKEQKIIYSVGEDLIDSGGSRGEDWQKMEDPTFMIDF